jgi:integrase
MYAQLLASALDFPLASSLKWSLAIIPQEASVLAKITKQTVNKMQSGSMIWDTVLIGFGVRKQLKSPHYLIRYRISGRQRFLSLGRHGALTPDTARREATRLLGVVASGADPAVAKAEAKARCGETLGAEITRYLECKRSALKPRTYVETAHHLLQHAKPLHHLPLTKIDRRTIAQRLGEIGTSSGPVARNRVRSSLSSLFTWAIKEGLAEINPVSGTGLASEGGSRDRVLSEAELATVLRALDDGPFSDIVRMLVLTGMRRSEVGGLRWSEIDFSRNLIVLPAARVKNKRQFELPISTQVRSIIERQQRREGHIFGTGKGGYSNWSEGKAKLDTRLNGMAEWHLHDLRRSAATMMADRLNVMPHVIEAVLNHYSGHRAGVAGIYQRAKYQDQMRDALQAYGDWIDTLTR